MRDCWGGSRSGVAAVAAATVAAPAAASTAATAAVAATAAPAAAAATVATPAATAATAAATVVAGPGLIDRQRPALVGRAVEPVDGPLGLLVIVHLDETE